MADKREYDIQLGVRLRAARQAAGLTLDDVAAAFSVTRPAIGHWETGRRGVRAEELAVLAGLLHASPAWLLTGEHSLSPSAAHRIQSAATTLADVASVLGEVSIGLCR